MSVSSFMGYLKGKSSLMIYEKYPELKYKYRNREFWCSKTKTNWMQTLNKSIQDLRKIRKSGGTA